MCPGKTADRFCQCTKLAFSATFKLMRSIKSDDDALLLLGAPWGAVFLGEKVAVAMAGGGAALLLGVALTTGMLRFGAGSATPLDQAGQA